MRSCENKLLSFNIHRVSASNIDVFTLEGDIVVDPCLEIISFLWPNHTLDVVLELVVFDILNQTLVHFK